MSILLLLEMAKYLLVNTVSFYIKSKTLKSSSVIITVFVYCKQKVFFIFYGIFGLLDAVSEGCELKYFE